MDMTPPAVPEGAVLADPVVGSEETTYVSSPNSSTDRPVLADDKPVEYYAYRITRPHTDWGRIKVIIMQYSSNWCVGLHLPDKDEADCEREHFHCVFCDFDKKKVDAFKKAIAKAFDAKGNGLHAGRFRDNHVSRAIGYMKHDESCTFYHDGNVRWEKLIEESTTFEKGLVNSVLKKREKLGDPVLTYSNLLKQAKLYRDTHMATSCSLQDVLSRMVNQSNWIPSRELVTNGVPRELHEMFVDRCTKSVREYNWLRPHKPSADKEKWLPVYDATPIAGMVENVAAPIVYKRVKYAE